MTYLSSWSDSFGQESGWPPRKPTTDTTRLTPLESEETSHEYTDVVVTTLHPPQTRVYRTFKGYQDDEPLPLVSTIGTDIGTRLLRVRETPHEKSGDTFVVVTPFDQEFHVRSPTVVRTITPPTQRRSLHVKPGVVVITVNSTHCHLGQESHTHVVVTTTPPKPNERHHH